MTWSVSIMGNITRDPGSCEEWIRDACSKCKHGYSKDRVWPHETECYLPRIQMEVGQLLTAIDRGADDHMAGGEAILHCYGFEPIQEAIDEEVRAG